MESLRNMCRVCLRVEDSVPLLNWHLPIDDLEENLSHVECFQQCTQLNLLLNNECDDHDHATKAFEHFCYSCAAKLKESYLFIRMARDADATLRMDYLKLYSKSNKFFEWVGVDRESTLHNTNKNDSDEVALTERCSNFFKSEDSNSTQCMQTLNEASLCELEVISLSNRKIPNISKKTHNADSKTSKTLKSLNRKDIKDGVVCSVCKKSMTRKHLLHHSCNRNIEYFLCKSCPRTFTHRSTLLQHEQIHENNRERKFTCSICERKFFTKMARKNHLKIHDPSRKPCFHCDECDQSFLFKGNLLVHKQKHAGQMIQCKYCEKQYVRSVDLEVHLRSHTGDMPFKCDKCDKAFTKKSSLQKHLLLHEGVHWKCDDCGKEYLYEWTLQRHRLQHTGMPLRCSICEKGFPEMYKIQRHIKGVHKVNLCEIEKFVVRFGERKKRETFSDIEKNK